MQLKTVKNTMFISKIYSRPGDYKQVFDLHSSTEKSTACGTIFAIQDCLVHGRCLPGPNTSLQVIFPFQLRRAKIMLVNFHNNPLISIPIAREFKIQ